MRCPEVPGGREARVPVGLAWVSLAIALASCSSPGRSFPKRPSLLEPAQPLAAEDAEWRYHPRKPSRLEQSYALPGGRELLVGAAGERWLAEPARKRSYPAAMLAPETLVGALVAKRVPWVFVGESGTTYDAETPTGAFIGSSAPLVDMAEVASGTNNVLAVSRDGELWLSEDAGLGWREVGPPDTRFADVLLAPPFGVALEIPERVWWSDDEGRSWQPLEQAPFGARRLLRDAEAGPVLESALETRAIGFEGGARLAPLPRALRALEPELGFPAARGPSARAIATGRAFDRGGRYFEVVLGAKAETLSGPALGELDRRSAPYFSACNAVAVAGHESWVFVACTRERSGSSRQFEFFRSADGGESFEREPFVARGDPELVRLAVGGGGALLATGFCAPAENVAGCRPEGIARREEAAGDAGVSSRLTPVAAPALDEHARGLAFSADGRTAYAIGPRTKSDALFAFVATDLDRGFTARPIAALENPDARGPTELLQLSVSGEGQLSLVLAQASGTQRLVVLDASGRALSVNAPPIESAVLGAYGNRALAVSPDTVWQSLNGGAEWESVGRLPRAVCAASAGRCSLGVACSAAGCTLGESLSRVGWRRGGEPSVVREPAPAPRLGGVARRALGPAISCDLSSTEWAELRGVDRLPDAAQAALGKAAWFALSTDENSAAVGLWVAEVGLPLDRGARVRYSELFGPASNPAEVAFHATVQVEGAAALRYRVPSGSAAAGVPLGEVDVAWENLLEGQHRRASIPDAGDALPGDFVKGEGAARRAQPDLVSIASGGIFVRVHRQPQHAQISYFLDGQSIERVPPLSWPAPLPKDASLEMARIGNESLQLAFVDRGASVLRARRRGDVWKFDGMTIGYQDPGAFSLEQHREIAYAGKGPRAGIQLTTVRHDGSSGSQLFVLRADGPVFDAPLAVPTQRDLGDAPLACDAEQRLGTPRTIAPYHPGRRRPLVVHDAVEPERVFLTDAAVLRGTPARACVDAFDADMVKTPGATTVTKERALVSFDGPSWLFRVAADSTRRQARIEHRAMTCRPDPAVEPPAEVYELPGTTQNE